MIERPLGVSEVADLLALTNSSVKRLPPDELPFFRVNPRGDRRYVRADVEAYIAARRVGLRREEAR